MLDELLKNIVSWAANTGIKLIIAVVIMLISFKVINFAAKRIKTRAEKRDFDKTLLSVLIYLFKLGGKSIVAVCLIGYVGIDTSGITALIASLGVGFGLAVNGALANIAGGILLIVTRPFRVDDYIEAQGVSGTVTDIHMTNTKIITPDNKVIYLPNGTLANGNIINYSEKDVRRVDLSFTVSRDCDSEKVKGMIMSLARTHELTLSDPAPFVRVKEAGKDGVEITCRIWTNSGDYWTVYFDMVEGVKAVFEKNDIDIPVQRINVNMSDK